ncbi:sulfotransferase family protein [Paracoccus liaowanqingii]|uniref:Sulfotransferase family protein n=1 Tax=Paracoccus liaowanqingii TaxID=2560053 RepID=A0A4P7HJ36_9RHOB|nr:sulfotransferase family 2 domain-containing protein [Paracoccus liaowanqingii]QBX34124.1 sulfotransferase family protein [Paracoccus liaowanqingii]
MLIFWDQRLVFLATPKAGSTAIEMALDSLASASLQRPAALKHTDIGSFRRYLGPWLEAQTGDRFTTVALMREPVDWLRSWYRFKLRDDDDDPDHAMAGIGFAEFAQGYAQPDGPSRMGIGRQVDFLTEAETRVDRIFRYDRIDGFVDFLEGRLDCAIELPRINVPPSVDVNLDPGAEAALRLAMARDLALYDAL